MKRLILASMLLATPALAQQPPAPAGQRAWEIMFQREAAAHQSDLGAAVQMQDQIAALTKQEEADKKTIADLTAKAAGVPAEKIDPKLAK